MRIVPKELAFLNMSNNIIFHDKITFDILKNKIGYKVYFQLASDLSGYFISSSSSNSILFEITKKNTKKYEFQFNILGYSSDNGVFPYCKTKEDAMKLFNAILAIALGKSDY